MIKRILCLTGAILTMTGCIGAGKLSEVKPQGQGLFPKLEGIDLQGKTRRLPDSFAGKLNIVTVAFEQEQQEDVNTWISLADEIIKDNKTVRFYEIPLIYKLNAPYRMWVNNGMRSGIPDEAARERTITVYTDREAFTKLMNMQTQNIYTLLLDDQGKILWRAQGTLTKPLETELLEKIKTHAQ